MYLIDIVNTNETLSGSDFQFKHPILLILKNQHSNYKNWKLKSSKYSQTWKAVELENQMSSNKFIKKSFFVIDNHLL